MKGWHLTLRQAPALRVDLRGVTPMALAGLPAAEVGRLPIPYGNTRLPLGELFDIATMGEEGALHFEGDLARCDRIGWQMDSGRIHVDGHS